jgi:acyl carrier protein
LLNGKSVRKVIEGQMRAVAKEQGRRLARLHDELALLDSGLDSLCFAILVVRLEDELGVDPLGESEAEEPPRTYGEFVQLYVDALA